MNCGVVWYDNGRVSAFKTPTDQPFAALHCCVELSPPPLRMLNLCLEPGSRSRGISRATGLLSTKDTYETDEWAAEEKGLHRFSPAGLAAPANKALFDDRRA